VLCTEPLSEVENVEVDGRMRTRRRFRACLRTLLLPARLHRTKEEEASRMVLIPPHAHRRIQTVTTESKGLIWDRRGGGGGLPPVRLTWVLARRIMLSSPRPGLMLAFVPRIYLASGGGVGTKLPLATASTWRMFYHGHFDL
jgi:hypothetical protein